MKRFRIYLTKESDQFQEIARGVIKFKFKDGILEIEAGKVTKKEAAELYKIYNVCIEDNGKLEVSECKLPSNKGQKIGWLLGFKRDKRKISLKNLEAEFNSKNAEIIETSDKYKIVFTKSEDRIFPAICWVSDRITQDEVRKLLEDLRKHGVRFKQPKDYVDKFVELYF